MLELAILGGTPIRTNPYPAWPEYDERELEAVARVIRSRNWGGFPYPGPNSAAFTQKFAELQGGGYAVLMANGTITMEVALRASSIGWGDEVIIPACTFQATAAATMAAGAIPVIVDIDPETFCIDPEKIEGAITPRTRAIIPVHLASQATDLDAILEISGKHNLVVIEDCAHAHGGRWNGKGLGTLGDFGSFSLQSSKTLTTGEGGVLLCRTAESASRAASLIDCGRPHSPEFPFKEVESTNDGEQIFTMGANYRMSEIQAALGLVALERFPQQMAQRIEMRSYLEESLSEIPGIRLLRRDPRHTSPAFYRYSFAIDPQVFGANNQVVCGLLWTEGIPCEPGYPPMHRYELFNPALSKLPVPNAFPEYFQFEKMHFPVAERICEQEAVWLEEQVFRAGSAGIDDVAKTFRKILDHRASIEQAAAKLKEMFLG